MSEPIPLPVEKPDRHGGGFALRDARTPLDPLQVKAKWILNIGDLLLDWGVLPARPQSG